MRGSAGGDEGRYMGGVRNRGVGKCVEVWEK